MQLELAVVPASLAASTATGSGRLTRNRRVPVGRGSALESHWHWQAASAHGSTVHWHWQYYSESVRHCTGITPNSTKAAASGA